MTGRNGVGKTSILEALSLLAPGRGLRRARLDDLYLRTAERQAASWSVSARLRCHGEVTDVGTGCDASTPGGHRRQLRVNGQSARAQTALAELVSVLWLTPDMDRLFLDSASARRRFLDRMIFSTDPSHSRRLNAYERAMQERMQLLRDGSTDTTWLSALEDGMATQGVAIAASRIDITEQLTAVSRETDAFPDATIHAEGTVEAWLREQPALAVEDRFRHALYASRRADTESGGASVGPHRSDMHVCHAATGRPARLCSTGEQKALLITLVLAGGRLHAKIRGFAPLILLDEVAAHLDQRHRAALFELVAGLAGQAWYAGTDRDVFAPMSERAQFFTIGESRAGLTSARDEYADLGEPSCP